MAVKMQYHTSFEDFFGQQMVPKNLLNILYNPHCLPNGLTWVTMLIDPHRTF